MGIQFVQTQEYPQPDIRGANPQNAHSDSTFSSHVHNDWTQLQLNEYPQPDIRGANPQNSHSDSTFSSHLHNDWTNDWVNYEHRLRNFRDDNDFALNFDNTGF